jgi:pyruvate kinase
VDLPVLAPKDIEDVQLFACKNQMDFIAASFVQVRTSSLPCFVCKSVG